MLNYNGQILSKSECKFSYQNRAFKYGDAIFDTLKYENDKIHFIEEHYFRLMSSMRMLRMKIPMNFTLKFYEDEILKVLSENKLKDRARIRVTIFRKNGGLYLPNSKDVEYLIEVENLLFVHFDSYEIELYKDFPVYSGILSNIKTNNRMINVVASIFASEFNYQNCILINEKKNIVEAINANIFLIKGDDIFTPALTEGCVNGIIRKKVIEIINKNSDYCIQETAISPFELLKADEVFLTNSIINIQSITKYRKKEYSTEKTENLIKIFKKYAI